MEAIKENPELLAQTESLNTQKNNSRITEDIWNKADLLTIEPRTSQTHLKSLPYLKLIW